MNSAGGNSQRQLPDRFTTRTCSGISNETLQALTVLEKRFKASASSDLKNEGAALATRISTFFRSVAAPLTYTYSGGESDLARFLKDAAAASLTMRTRRSRSASNSCPCMTLT